jgi:enoyl-CoA hydratase
MDLVLTGRAVHADEAERIGLVNRVVPPGTAKDAAQELARQIAGHPQRCARNDRLSLLEQEGLSEEEALAKELTYGRDSLEDVVAGLERFRSGEGRHGAGT